MKLEKELGGYSMSIVRLYGSFQTNGTGAPTVFRDGNTRIVGVVRNSAGLYTVTLAQTGTNITPDRFPIPKTPIAIDVTLESAAAPVVIAQAYYVGGSWSQANRTFQIVVYHTSGTPGVGDPDSGQRISFEVIGSITSVGTDPA